MIKIDQEFLDRILEKQANIEKKVDELAKARISEARETRPEFFPVEVKGVVEHQRITVEKQKEFFEEVKKLMIKFRVVMVNARLRVKL